MQQGYADTETDIILPSVSAGDHGGYYFGCWEVNGERLAGSTGLALSSGTLALTNDVIAIASEGDGEIQAKASETIHIPDCGPYLTAVLATVPLQLLAYHVACLKGTDVDQPRNLAKSVTVE